MSFFPYFCRGEVTEANSETVCQSFFDREAEQ
jgi:hypothetical protein